VLNQNLVRFDVDFLLIFSLSNQRSYYNSALQDSRALLENNPEGISGAINEIDKPLLPRLLRTRQ